MKKILLIEDNPPDIRLFEICLEQAIGKNYALKTVELYSHALEHLEKEKFDLIFLDAFLPDSRGFGGITKIINQSKGTKLVMLSGYEDTDFQRKALEKGVNVFINKSRLSGNLLKEVIEEHL
ncbi:MAG: hypothetical protein A3H98_01660 [Bacteroidetes bacterium RIFCSPLOWO2_02_FULL_36_8]|nr:MAG: hypothetical protein A3H98_01660 [Bacteroidetes bacterium RIFCSPLOWO2_02_FULL_36_8]OFY69362.1 MAG: hypothetical protein A3G23_00995 [Bacteroidetes bacterium RIFCSPLOWO2_12_FULL_37_12]